jgi:hypothetical protein
MHALRRPGRRAGTQHQGVYARLRRAMQPQPIARARRMDDDATARAYVTAPNSPYRYYYTQLMAEKVLPAVNAAIGS